jgi:hypothetical protein
VSDGAPFRQPFRVEDGRAVVSHRKFTKGSQTTMAKLTNLESKIGEVLGLAMGAQAAIRKVSDLLEDGDPSGLAVQLEKMHAESAETEKRCIAVAGSFDGKKTAILEEGREVKGEAVEMMSTYLEGETNALDGFEFLTMAEAGEVGHWSIIEKFNERANNVEVAELVAWALPIQQGHYDTVLAGSLTLAADEDPDEPA